MLTSIYTELTLALAMTFTPYLLVPRSTGYATATHEDLLHPISIIILGVSQLDLHPFCTGTPTSGATKMIAMVRTRVKFLL